jgi:hypothetical protein
MHAAVNVFALSSGAWYRQMMTYHDWAVGAVAQGNVEHGAVLGEVDLLAVVHLVAPLAHLSQSRRMHLQPCPNHVPPPNGCEHMFCPITTSPTLNRTNEKLADPWDGKFAHTLACLARSKSSFMVSSLTRFLDQSTCYKVACIDDDKGISGMNTISQ